MGVGARVCLVVGFGALVAALAMIGGGFADAEEQTASVRVPFQAMGGPALATTVTVAKGDHLWKIARRHLQAVMGDELSSRQITSYWRSLIVLNHDRLRSGDPNLIYPGEVIALPELQVSGPP